jgi:sporulation protein YlmC with PRC-barrel domain
MDSKMQLQKNAAVLTADGQTIGSLNRVVVDPASKALNAIVVRVGGMFRRKEKVVPIQLVVEATEEHIVLNGDAGDVDAFPPLEEEVPVRAGTPAPRPALTGNPSAMPVLSVGGAVSQIRQNIPEGTIAMDENPKIITLEGIHVGNVECVVADPSDEHVTGLIISNGLFVKAVKLIPIQWVTAMGIEHIHLRVKKSSVEALEDISRDG